MLRVRAALSFAVLLAPVVANCQSDPALWRFVHPDAKAVIGIDWGRIRQSPAGAMIRDKWLSAEAMPGNPAVELLDDVDRILISSPGKNSSDDSAESPILIAIHGKFDAAQVRRVFARSGAKPQSYNSFQVYRPQSRNRQGNDAKDSAWVLFDAETILYGDAPSVFAALNRNEFASAAPQSPAPGSLLARAAAMDPGYDLWVFMDAMEIASNDEVATLFRGDDWASEAQTFEVGANLRSGLAADITIRFSSDEAAKRVTAGLTHMSAGAQMQGIAKKLKFTLDGSATKIALRLTEQELEASVEAFAAGQKASTQLAANPAPVANSTPRPAPAPAKPSVIRIEGLDEGTREIPYPDPPR